MARADFSGVFLVVVEILLGQNAVLVADKTIACNTGRIELDLDLDVFRDGEERRPHLFDQDLAAFAD